MRVKRWVEGVSSMSMVRFENSRTRGPVVDTPADAISINACKIMPVPTKAACCDDPACLSSVVELVYCTWRTRKHLESMRDIRVMPSFIAKCIGGTSTYKKAGAEQQSSRVWKGQQTEQSRRLCAFAEAAQEICRGA